MVGAEQLCSICRQIKRGDCAFSCYMTKIDQILNDLPYDIFVNIFSHLDQQDCITCMTVCRSWYSTAPQYFQDVWSTLRLSSNAVPNANKCWDFCIINFCRSILFDGYSDKEKLYEAMERVAQLKCKNIETIGTFFKSFCIKMY